MAKKSEFVSVIGSRLDPYSVRAFRVVGVESGRGLILGVSLFQPVEHRAFWFLKQYSEFKLRGLFNGWNYHLPKRYQL